MKIFVFSSRFPYPIERGDKLRLYHQIIGLSKKHEVHLYALHTEIIDNASLRELEKYCTNITTFRINPWTQWLQIVKSFFTKVPFQVAYFYHRKFHKIISEGVNIYNPDIIFCQLIRMAPYAEQLDTPKVIDYMDAYGVGMERRSKIAKWFLKGIYRLEAKRTQFYEAQIFKKFDQHTIISSQDAALIPVPSIQIVPNGIDYTFFTSNDKPKIYDIGFIGNMGYLPNVDAAEILCKQILPLLQHQSKTPLKVLIAGARPHQRILRLASDNVTISGWVQDIREAYQSCKIMVAPLFNGTGQQNKILEAMAMEIPCITTASVNHAIGAKPDEEIIIAQTIEEFVSEINTILENKDKYQRIKENCRNFVIKRYGWEPTIQKLNTIFASLAKTK